MFFIARQSNIIKRAFCHHRDLIQTPASTISHHLSRDEINENVNKLVSKIDIIDKKVNNIDKYIFLNFALIHGIYFPTIIYLL